MLEGKTAISELTQNLLAAILIERLNQTRRLNVDNLNLFNVAFWTE